MFFHCFPVQLLLAVAASCIAVEFKTRAARLIEKKIPIPIQDVHVQIRNQCPAGMYCKHSAGEQWQWRKGLLETAVLASSSGAHFRIPASWPRPVLFWCGRRYESQCDAANVAVAYPRAAPAILTRGLFVKAATFPFHFSLLCHDGWLQTKLKVLQWLSLGRG